MLAEMVDHVVGVDPDRDWITAAVVDTSTTGVVATAWFPAKSAGYKEAVAWADEYSTDTERAWAVEGTSSYGRGISALLARSGEWVIEFDRAKEKASKDGAKTDTLDAVRAARETLGRENPEPRSWLNWALSGYSVSGKDPLNVETYGGSGHQRSQREKGIHDDSGNHQQHPDSRL